jgi:pectinesterase
VSYPELSADEEKKLTPRALLAGSDGWDPVAEADALRKLR